MNRKKIFVVAHFFQKKVKNKNFVGIKWLKSEREKGDLYALKMKKGDDETTPLQFWERKNDKIQSLIELTRIKTLHSVDDFLGREDVSYAAPLYSEVLEQIPREMFFRVVAFEVLASKFFRSDGYDTITTILYEKTK